MRYLQDLALGERFACGSFRLSRAEIVAFASRYDPQPFHLDDDAAAASYFGRLCASGLHTQGAAIGLLVPAISDVAVVAGYALHESRFFVPVWPDQPYVVDAVWTAIAPSPRSPGRGRAEVSVDVADTDGQKIAALGVTYVVRTRPAQEHP